MNHILAIIVAILAIPFSFLQATDGSRPNIVFFVGDNWSWPHASVLGDPTVKTPMFDRIVTEGVLFQNAFCPVPSCSPTRSCILTGRAAHQLGEVASLWSLFPRKLKVFTDALRDVGYEIGMCGKGWSPGNYKDYGWPENPVGKSYEDFAMFMTQRDPNKPFFFWNGNTNTSLNKWGYDPNRDTLLDVDTIKVPPELPSSPEVRKSILDYYGGVTRMDADAGRVIGELEKRQTFDDTLFIYTSDNGWQMPRGLANVYDTGTRLPMAMRWGNKIQSGRKVDEFISLTDLAPTFLELAGLTIPAEMTGRSFLDVLLGKPSAAPRDHVFLERERHANVRKGDLGYPIRSLRTRDFLYIWNMRPDRWPASDPVGHVAVGDYGDVDGSGAKQYILANAAQPEMQTYISLSFAKRPEVELYDLNNDPYQLTNIAGKPAYAAAQSELFGRLVHWLRTTDDPRVDPNYDAWDTYPYFGGNFRNQTNGKAKAK